MSALGSGKDHFTVRRLRAVVDRAGEHFANGQITELEMCRMVACEAAGLGIDAMASEQAERSLTDAALAAWLREDRQ